MYLHAQSKLESLAGLAACHGSLFRADGGHLLGSVTHVLQQPDGAKLVEGRPTSDGPLRYATCVALTLRR